MLRWLKQPSFWIFVLIVAIVLFLVFQVSVLIAGLILQGIGTISAQHLKYSAIGILFFVSLLTIYYLWPTKKEHVIATEAPKVEEKKKNDIAKNDTKDKKTIEQNSNGCLLPLLIILLSVVMLGTFWGEEISSLISDLRVKISTKRYSNGTLSRWSSDDTGKLLPPKTFPIRIIRWDKQKILIEMDYVANDKKRVAILEWNRKEESCGRWYQPYPEMSGKWWIPETSAGDEYAGWTNNDRETTKHPLIIKKLSSN